MGGFFFDTLSSHLKKGAELQQRQHRRSILIDQPDGIWVTLFLSTCSFSAGFKGNLPLDTGELFLDENRK